MNLTVRFIKPLVKRLSVMLFMLRHRGVLRVGSGCLLAGCKVKATGGSRANSIVLGNSVSLRKCEFILNGGVTELPLPMG